MTKCRFPAADVPSGSCAELGDGRVVATRDADGSVVAFENTCPHLGQRLSDALVKDGVLRCPHHFWGFDVRTGANIADGHRLTAVPHAIIGNEIEVKISDPAPTPSMQDVLREHARTWSRDRPT